MATLRAETGVEVVGDTASGALGLETVRRLKPDILITDLLTTDMGGVEVISLAHKEWPWVGIIVWSDYASSACLRLVMRAGARGFITKDHYKNDMVTAIRKVALGERCFCPAELARYCRGRQQP